MRLVFISTACMKYLSYIIFILGLFLSAKTFFYETGHRGANRFLAAFLFAAAFLFFAIFNYFFGTSVEMLTYTIGGMHQIYFLLGPLAYFYVRGTLRDDAQIKAIELLHFAPFCIVLAGQFPYILSPWEEKIRIVNLLCTRNWADFSNFRLNMFLSFRQSEVLRIGSMLGYSAAQWTLIWKYCRSNDLTDSSYVQFILMRRWLLLFVGLYSILSVQWTALGAYLLVRADLKTLEQVTTLICLSISIFYLILNTGVFVFNNLLNGLVITPVGLRKKNNNPLAFNEGLPPYVDGGEEVLQMWYKSLFQPEYLHQIGHLLEHWSGQKKYLDRANLADLAKETGIPSHHLTYYFNSILGRKFTDWRNDLRIAHAKLLIDEGIMDTLNLEGIANRCGYSSRTAFSRVFKNATGLTPSEYYEGKPFPIPDSK